MYMFLSLRLIKAMLQTLKDASFTKGETANNSKWNLTLNSKSYLDLVLTKYTS